MLHTISATIAFELWDVFTFEFVHPPPLTCCLTCWCQNLTCVLGRNVCTVYIIIFPSVAISTQDIFDRHWRATRLETVSPHCRHVNIDGAIEYCCNARRWCCKTCWMWWKRQHTDTHAVVTSDCSECSHGLLGGGDLRPGSNFPYLHVGRKKTHIVRLSMYIGFHKRPDAIHSGGQPWQGNYRAKKQNWNVIIC